MKKKEEPIRIAQIVGKWLGGGVEAVVMNYYRHLDHDKIQFDFICDDDSTNIPYDEIEKLGGKVILIPPYQKVFKYQKELRRVLREGKYKIVHSHINTLSVFPLYAAKKVGVPVRIAHSHSTTNKKEWKKNLLKQVLRPFSKKYATNYMCCSELAGRWLFGDKAYDEGKVYLLNNAIDLDKFKYDKKIRDKKRKELGIKEDTIVIGHIGRFVAQKNHTFLIDIFNEIHKLNQNSILLLIGQGPLQEEINGKVKELGLDDSVKFLGQREDVHEYYNVMDLFLFPSLYEGLGMVMIEAQANGLTCIASTEVPLAASIMQNTYFFSLDDTSLNWAKNIFNIIKSNTRTKFNKESFLQSGYSINENADKLFNFYFDRVGNYRISQKQLTIDEIKQIEVNILSEIDKLCTENGIEYCLCGGSMLGAIRHKGFIPWDDDIDIYLKRTDYEELKKIIKDGKTKKWLSVIDDEVSEYYYPFSKIVDNRTVAKMSDNLTPHGIWVDIFPIDYITSDKRKRVKVINKFYYYRSLIIGMTTDFTNLKFSKKVVVKKLIYLLSSIFGKGKIYKKYKKYISKNTYDYDTGYVSCPFPTYKLNEIFETDDLFIRSKYEFEGQFFWGPKNYDKYLSQLYGDYMKLPPVEQRRTHEINARRIK